MDMGTKSTSQQAAADESHIKHDEHDTLPFNDTPCVAIGHQHHVSRLEKATDILSLSSKALTHDTAFGASDDNVNEP